MKNNGHKQEDGHFGHKLREILKKRDMYIWEFANKTDIAYPRLVRILDGAKPEIAELIRMKEVLKFETVDELITADN